MEVWVRESTDQPVTNFKDVATETYGTGVDLCGKKSYTIYYEDKVNVVVEDWLAISQFGNSDSYQIILQTDDPALYTNAFVQYWVKVTLDDYVSAYEAQVTHWEPLLINILNCQVVDISPESAFVT